MSRQITLEEVAKHNKEEDAWLVIDGKVYNVTEFIDEHPGGEGVLIAYAGTDATKQFHDVIHSSEASELMKDLQIGVLAPSGGGGAPAQGSARSGGKPEPVIVVGAGLAGASAALTVLEHGLDVILVEKWKKLGGNSVRASSGLNAAGTVPQKDQTVPDSVDLFVRDTSFSATKSFKAKPSELVTTLCGNSAAAHEWLDGHNIKLPVLSQCGGHSAARTHRPTTGAAGGYMTLGLLRKVRQAAKAGRVTIKKRCKVVKLDKNSSGRVIGVTCEDQKTGSKESITGSAVVLCTGGFCYNKQMLQEYSPFVADLPTTNGPWATGDGMTLAKAAGAQLVDMEYVQVHPTGFIKRDKPDEHEKILAAECLRAAGALLINSQGRRFVNELEHRDWVSAAERRQEGKIYLLLNSKAVEEVAPHVKMYRSDVMGRVLRDYQGIEAVAQEIGCQAAELRDTLKLYNAAAAKGWDASGKDRFPAVPYLPDDKFTMGVVTPLLHYVMGGIAINPASEVLDEKQQVIPGLFAAGETAGGVHGKNRLAGNSLIECVVYGRIAGKSAAMSAGGAVRSKL